MVKAKIGWAMVITACGGLLAAVVGLTCMTATDATNDPECEALDLVANRAAILADMAAGRDAGASRAEIQAQLGALRAEALARSDPALAAAALRINPSSARQSSDISAAEVLAVGFAARGAALAREKSDAAARAAAARGALAEMIAPGFTALAVGLALLYLERLSARSVLSAIAAMLPPSSDALDVRVRRLLASYEIAAREWLETYFVKRGLAEELREKDEALERYVDYYTYDPLTRLPRGEVFVERAAGFLEAFIREGVPFFVGMIDLDFFKRVNDTRGHEAGNRMLRLFAECLVEAQGAGLVARLHGDEFAVVAAGGPAHAAAFFDRLSTALSARELADEDGGTPMRLTASVGVTYGHQADLDELERADSPGAREVEVFKLMKRADNAVYDAKLSGRNCIREFVPGGASADRHAAIEPLELLTRHLPQHFSRLESARQRAILDALWAAAREALPNAVGVTAGAD